MLSTIDTVIAFAVIMTILSLFIIILVQMISGALSLRGKNLANALALTFQTIDSRVGEHAHALAAQILSDPIFSDSIFAPKSRTAASSKNRHLRALAKAQRQIIDSTQALIDKPNDPAQKKIQTHAQERAQEAWAALQIPRHLHPWRFFSFGGHCLGSAIRPDEIYRILHEISALPPAEAVSRGIAPLLVQVSQNLLESLKTADEPTLESKKKLRAVVDAANLFHTDAQKRIITDSLVNMSATVERATTQAYDRFQIWFGSAQDRAEQWFQLHIRLTTITAAALTAVLLQLDTPEIFRLMRDRPILVENLAKAAPGVSEQSKSVIDQTSAARQAEGMNIAGKLRQENFETLQKNLAETGFNFMPSKFLGRWDEDAGEIPEWARSIHPKLAHLLVHLFGLLLSVVLLTLGAPLWFNLLKNLMSLRPAVATLIEKRPLSAPALPASPSTPPVAN